MQGCQFFLCLLCNRVVPSCFFDKVFRLRHSPPHGGGVDATSTKYREASFEERTGWSLTSHISECVLNMACERPPRLRRFGGFATFSYWRSHPSSVRRGVSCPNRGEYAGFGSLRQGATISCHET